MARVAAACAGRRRRSEKIADASRNRWRRIEKCDRPGGEPLQAVDQQWIMGARQNDGVGARAIVAEARGDFGVKRFVADRRAGKLRLGIGGEGF